MYTAVVIEPACRQRLMAVVQETFPIVKMNFHFNTHTGNPLPHHMTLGLGSFDDSLNDRTALGSKTEMIVDALCLDEDLGACAGRVVRAIARPNGAKEFELRSANEHPHITLCLKPGCRPVLSNRLAWKCEKSLVLLPEPLRVFGIVEECD